MPTYTITAPDGKTYEIEGPDGASQEDVAYAVLAKNPQAGTPPDPRKQGFTPALKAGYQKLKGDIGALAGRTGIMGTEAAEQYRSAQEAKAHGLFTPTEEGWTDAPWQKTKETLGGSLPYMAAPVAAGGAAALAGAPTAVGMGVAGLASGLQFTGTNLARQMDEGKRLKDTSLAGAAGAAVPQAALDMLSFKMAPGIRLLFTQAGKEIAPKAAAQIAQQSIKQVAADYAKATGTAMTAEGLTEAAQQVLERWQAGLSLTDVKAKAEYIDSLIGGAVLGGALSPAGRFVERGREEQKQGQEALAAKKQAMQDRAAQEQRAAEAKKQAEMDRAAAGADAPAQTQPIDNTGPAGPTQLDLPGMFMQTPEAPARPDVTPEARRIELLDQERKLADALEEHRGRVAQSATPEDTLAASKLFKQLETAHKQAQAELATIPITTPPSLRLAQVQKQWEKAKEEGDVDNATKYAERILELKKLGAESAPPDAMKQVPFKPNTFRQTGGVSETEDLFNQRVVGPEIAAGREQAAAQRTRWEEEQAALRRMAQRQEDNAVRETRKEREQALAKLAEDAATQAEVHRMERDRLNTGVTEQRTLPGVPGKAPLRSEVQRSSGMEMVKARAELVRDFKKAKARGDRAAMRDAVDALQDLEEQAGKYTSTPDGAASADLSATAPRNVGIQQDAGISRSQALVQLLQAEPEDVESARGRMLERLASDIEAASGKQLPQSARYALANEVNPILDKLMKSSRHMLDARTAQKAMDTIRNRLSRRDTGPTVDRSITPRTTSAASLREQLDRALDKPDLTPEQRDMLERADADFETLQADPAKRNDVAEWLHKDLGIGVQSDAARRVAQHLTPAKDVNQTAVHLDPPGKDHGAQGDMFPLDSYLHGPKQEKKSTYREIQQARLARRMRAAALEEERNPSEPGRTGSVVLPRDDESLSEPADDELRAVPEKPALTGRSEPSSVGPGKPKFSLAESERERKANEARVAKQGSLERLGELPGVRVSHEAYRDALQRLEEAPSRIADLQSRIANEGLPKTTRDKAKRSLKAVQQMVKLASGVLSHSGEEVEKAKQNVKDALEVVREKIDKQRAAVEENPTKSRKQTLAIQIRERNALTRLDNSFANFAKITPIETATEKSEKAADRAAEEYLQKALALEQEDTTGRLPARKIGPVVKKAVQAGNVRTGTLETQEERRLSARNKVEQAGAKRGVTAKQAVRAANEDVAQEQAMLEDARVEEVAEKTAEVARKKKKAATKNTEILRIEALQERNSAAMEKALAEGDEAAIAKYEAFDDRLARALEQAQNKTAGKETEKSKTVGEPEDTEYSMAGENEARTLYRTSTKTGPSIKIATIERVTAQMTEGWEKLPTVTVVQSETDLPQRIQDQAARDKKTGAIPGLFDPDSKTVYLVADNLRDESDIALTVMHEVAGHFGLRGVLGGTYSNTMHRLYEGNAPLREAVNAKMKAEPNLSKDVAVEEVLAEAVESGPLANNKLSNALHNVYYAIKQFLFKKLGLKSVSDREVQQVVANARRYVKQGVGGKGGTAESTGAVYRTPSYGEQADTPLADLADKMVARPKTFKEKFLSNMGLGFEMQAVDMRAPIREMLKLGAHVTPESEALGMQAMYNVTKSDQRVALLMTAMSSGPLEVYKDGKGLHGVRSTGENSAKDVFTAIADLPGGNERGKMAMATTYMIAQRAANVGIEKAGFDDMAVTQPELDAVMAQVNADPELKAALEGVRKKYNAYNKGMIEFLADTGAIPKTLAKELLANEDYVPFYRVNNNGMADLVFSSEHTIALGDIRHQPYLQSLKGGDTKILPLNESLSRNTTLLIDKAMTNLAAKGFAYAAQEMGAGKIRTDVGNAPAGSDVIRFNQEPDANNPKDTGARWMKVNTEGTVMEGVPSDMVVKSLEGAHVALPAFLKLGAYAGDILRSGITRTPLYVMRQLIRDPMAATFTSGLPNNPMTAVYKAGKEFLADSVGTSEAAAKLIKKGIIQSGIFTGDHDDIAKFSLQLASGKDQNAVQRLFAMLDRAAMRADASTRVLVHENALKQGLSEVEADMMTMESMNFHKRGLSPSVQYANRLIPFFNAQLQGLNVLYKAARGRMPYNEQLAIKTKFMNNAMLLFGTGLVYAAAMEDDEDFRNAKPRDRYSNFFVSLPGVDAKLKIPLPYEMGFIFSAAVAAVDGMREDVGGAAQAEALTSMLTNSIPGASSMGVPQLVKPAFETWLNTNFFSGQAIESASQKSLTPEERYSASTSEMAKALSKALPVLSPLQIEHLVKGYFGIIPLAIMNTANGLFATDDTVERPTPRITDTPLVGAAFQRKFGGGDADAAYTIAEDVRKVEGTFKKMQNEGRRADVQEFLEGHIRELRLGPAAKQFEVRMAKIKDQEMKIRASGMSADTKRERIDALDKIRQDTAAAYLKVFRQIEERSAA